MSDIDWELLDRYLAGEATAEERARVEAWLAEDPEHWAQLAALRDAIAQAALTRTGGGAGQGGGMGAASGELGGAGEAGESGVLARGRRDSRWHPGVPGPRRRRSRRRWSSAWPERSPLVRFCSTGVRRRRPRPCGSLQPRAASARCFGCPTEREWCWAWRARSGTRPISPDGPRGVSLEGEAYFDVVHDERRPFVVRAGELVATDLGTEFTVRAYPEDAGARVVVREGRVAIRAAGSAATPERVVAPGQLGRLGVGAEPAVEPADTAAYFAWTEGRLVFDGTPLRDALPQLSRWFDLEFRLADSSLGDVPLTATLKTQPTPDVLDNLAASLGMRQRRLGRTVTLSSAEPGR